MKTAQWIASNVWIHFNISLLRVKYRDDKLHSGVQLLKVFQNIFQDFYVKTTIKHH